MSTLDVSFFKLFFPRAVSKSARVWYYTIMRKSQKDRSPTMYPNLPGETPNGTKFAQRLRTVRNINRLTQDDLAQMLGTSRTVIAKWEMGKREPSLTGVVRICNLFDVSADYMLGRVDEITTEKP